MLDVIARGCEYPKSSKHVRAVLELPGKLRPRPPILRHAKRGGGGSQESDVATLLRRGWRAR